MGRPIQMGSVVLLELPLIDGPFRWEAHSDGEVDESLLDGLERRYELLIVAKDPEWSKLLDNEDFWKVGWGSKVED